MGTKRRWERALRVFSCMSLFTIMLVATPPAQAQDDSDDDLDDFDPQIEIITAKPGCELDGVQALCDGFYWGDADATFTSLGAAQDGVRLDLSADFDSTFFLDVIDGATTGTWMINGDWHMIFSGEVDGIANVTMTGNGAAVGSASTFTVSGTERNEGTVTIVGGSYPVSNSGPLAPVAVKVTGGNCIEVTGEWRLSWASLAKEVGWDGVDSITGGFSAFRQEQFDIDLVNELTNGVIDGTKTQADIDSANLPDLVKQFTTARARENALIDAFSARDTPPDNELVRQIVSLVEEFERIAALAKNLRACEQEMIAGILHKFSGWPAAVIADWASVLDDADATISGYETHNFARAAIRTGAIGAGSSLSQATQKKITEAIRTQLDSALERTHFVTEDGELRPNDVDDALEGLAIARAALAVGLVLEAHDEIWDTHVPDFLEASLERIPEFVESLPFEVDDDE